MGYESVLVRVGGGVVGAVVDLYRVDVCLGAYSVRSECEWGECPFVGLDIVPSCDGGCWISGGRGVW